MFNQISKWIIPLSAEAAEECFIICTEFHLKPQVILGILEFHTFKGGVETHVF